MSYDHNINWFYQEIYKELIDKIIDKLFSDASSNELLPEFLISNEELSNLYIVNKCVEEFNNIFDITPIDCKLDFNDTKIMFNFNIDKEKSDIERGFKDLFKEIMYYRFKYFIETNSYNIIYLYTYSKLSKDIEEDIKIGKSINTRLNENYTLLDLAVDPIFDEILKLLDCSYNDILYNDPSKIFRLVDFCSLEFPCITQQLHKLVAKYSTPDDKERAKSKIIAAFIKNNNQNTDNNKIKIINMINMVERLISLIEELYNKNKFHVMYIDDLQKLFKEHIIFEMFIFKLLAKLGFPTIWNVKIKEYEIDVLSYVTKNDIIMIEVTTRSFLNNKIQTIRKLMKELGKKGIDVKSIILILNKNYPRYAKLEDNIFIIPIQYFLMDYPYKIIATLHYIDHLQTSLMRRE